jgi:hypothetical protein
VLHGPILLRSGTKNARFQQVLIESDLTLGKHEKHYHSHDLEEFYRTGNWSHCHEVVCLLKWTFPKKQTTKSVLVWNVLQYLVQVVYSTPSSKLQLLL